MTAAACSTALLLGAYYYTWYGVGEQWKVFPRTFEPTLGEYKSASDTVMRLHHQQGREACLDFFAVSWGGDGTRAGEYTQPVSGRCVVQDSEGTHMKPFCTDMEGNVVEPERGKVYKVKGWAQPMLWWTPSAEVDDMIQRHLRVPNGLPMALMYEVRDVMGVGANEGLVDLSRGVRPALLEHHLLYAAETFFKHPRYFRVNGMPVLFLYTMRDYTNFEEPLLEALAAVERRIGVKLYLIGDVIWWWPPLELQPWEAYGKVNLSGVTAYNLFDNFEGKELMGKRFPLEAARYYIAVADYMRKRGMKAQMVPYISPGYDDRKMRGGDRPWVDRAEGATYLRAWQSIQWLLQCQQRDAGGGRRLVMLNSFNEWHEGTQIEPSVEFGRSYLDLTRALKHRALTDFHLSAGQRCELEDACRSPARGFQSWFRWQGHTADALAIGEEHWNESTRRAAAVAAAGEGGKVREAPEGGGGGWGADGALGATGGCLGLLLLLRRRLGWAEVLGSVAFVFVLCHAPQWLHPARSSGTGGGRLQEETADPASELDLAVPPRLALSPLSRLASEAASVWRAAYEGMGKDHIFSPRVSMRCKPRALAYALAPWPLSDSDVHEPCGSSDPTDSSRARGQQSFGDGGRLKWHLDSIRPYPRPRTLGLTMKNHPDFVTRRTLFEASIAPIILALTSTPAYAKRPACGDVDTCREQGDKKFNEAEKERGKIVRLGNGVSYRESTPGTGDIEVKEGDVVELRFQVLRGNGYYMYSMGYGKEPGQQDVGETLRVTVGKHDVPSAVEMALIGAKKGSVRKVEMPPRLGFETSAWQPAPTTFEGKQRMERYRGVLNGNGLQPGYNAVLLFEFEVQRVRPAGGGAA